HEIDKWYLAVIHGCPKQKSDTLTAYLKKDEDKKQVFLKTTPSQNSKMIKTAYQVLAQKDNLCLVKIQLLTGRTHQIRAHFSFLGHPLLGDGKYGNIQKDKKQGFRHQALCSYKLQFNFKTPAGCLEYLNKKSFQIERIWFVDELFGDIIY
ncbi:MAG: RNA pseudouridine synthase, partial [bacterium]|nr:RNA pseudouridine synthase [bacterium]